MPYRDAFAPIVGYHGPFPVAIKNGRVWMTHCYGIVGVGRDVQNTGSGEELYAVIGVNARPLDRNIAAVGRIIEGFDQLAKLPPGSGELGRYEKAEQHLPIVRVTLAADLPAASRPAYEWLRPESVSYARWVHARANWRNDFFIQPAGAVDVCHGMPPVRPVIGQPRN